MLRVKKVRKLSSSPFYPKSAGHLSGALKFLVGQKSCKFLVLAKELRFIAAAAHLQQKKEHSCAQCNHAVATEETSGDLKNHVLSWRFGLGSKL